MTDEVRHAKRSGFPGITMCGLREFTIGKIKYGKNRKACNCPACLDAIVRWNTTRHTQTKAAQANRRKYLLSKNPWRA